MPLSRETPGNELVDLDDGSGPLTYTLTFPSPCDKSYVLVKSLPDGALRFGVTTYSKSKSGEVVITVRLKDKKGEK